MGAYDRIHLPHGHVLQIAFGNDPDFLSEWIWTLVAEITSFVKHAPVGIDVDEVHEPVIVELDELSEVTIRVFFPYGGCLHYSKVDYHHGQRIEAAVYQTLTR